MAEQVFLWVGHYPYSTRLGIRVEWTGNGLPVHVLTAEDDPERFSSASMTVDDAELVHAQLGNAIRAAKKAGLHRKKEASTYKPSPKP